jgi:molecular chaperone DnaK (HSP70)
VQWLQDQYLHPAGVDTSSPSMSARLKALAEYAKVSLSDNEQVVLRYASQCETQQLHLSLGAVGAMFPC